MLGHNGNMTGIEESDIENASISFNLWWKDWKTLIELIVAVVFVHIGMLLIHMIWICIESVRRMLVFWLTGVWAKITHTAGE